MNTSPFASQAGTKRLATSAFTLIELLVVISIIALLAGILLPVIGSVMENARKVEAKNTVVQIVSAVKSFQTDYGVYPNPNASTNDITWNYTNNQNLFMILRASESAAAPVNTRHVVYFEGKDVKVPNKPKSGFTTQTATTTINGANYAMSVGALVDPWGVGYYIRYDNNYTDAVEHPYQSDTDGSNDDTTNTTQPSPFIRTGVIAWSYGKDGLKGLAGVTTNGSAYNYGDDVVSWQ